MAKATKSLEQYIIDSAPILEVETIELLDDISAGLLEMAHIVHRDLKPANILEHDGVWKLADLGLARFLDAGTSAHTMRDFLSAPYAAPEQWREERPTKAVDMYSIGCITYSLMTGHPPFEAEDRADYRKLHETVAPPPLPASPRLAALTLACLAKSPDLRPSVNIYRERLENVRTPNRIAAQTKLALAAAEVALHRNEEESAKLSAKIARDQRAAISAESVEQVKSIFSSLVALVKAEAPEAKVMDAEEAASSGYSKTLRMGVRLGDGVLSCDMVYPQVEMGKFGKTWDLFVLAKIEVCSRWGPSPICRSANLAFGKIGLSEMAWWEVGFMNGPNPQSWNDSAPKAPFSLGEGHSWAGYRAGINGLRWGAFGLAYNPIRIDEDGFERFHQRWIEFFARMALGDWTEPTLPEEPIENKFQMSF
jgi:serine/threonine-protein kinase